MASWLLFTRHNKPCSNQRLNEATYTRLIGIYEMISAQLNYVVALSYMLFQMFRLLCLAIFTVFMIDCTVYHSQTSVDCKINYTIYKSIDTPGCGPYCWKGLWIGCSCFTSIIVIFAVCLPGAHIEGLRPAHNIQVLLSLLRKQYFWHLNFVLILIILYDAIVIKNDKVTLGSSQVEMGVILSKVLTTYLIFQLNFTYPPKRDNFKMVYVFLYYLTLFMFVLDNSCKFVELSIRVSYKLYTVNYVNEGQQSEVLLLMLEIVDASLYHRFLSFFWNKIFRGKRDVLLTYSPDLAHSIEIPGDPQGYHEL